MCYICVTLTEYNTVLDCVIVLRRVFAELCEFFGLSGMRSKDEN